MSFNPLPLSMQDILQRNRQHAYNMLDLINQRGSFNVDALPKYDYSSRANALERRAQMLQAKAAATLAQPPNFVSGGGLRDYPAGTRDTGNAIPEQGQLGNFIRAIVAQESGGRYNAVSSAGALGKYQIMPANVPSWSKQVLGHSVSPSYFFHHPKVQDEIGRAMLARLFKKYGIRGAASSWFSGQPTNYQHSSQVNNYVQSILRRMGQ